MDINITLAAVNRAELARAPESSRQGHGLCPYTDRLAALANQYDADVNADAALEEFERVAVEAFAELGIDTTEDEERLADLRERYA